MNSDIETLALQDSPAESPRPALADLEHINQDIGETYDHQVYTSNAFPFTSPNHLRAAAHLYGLDSVPLAGARILELGCAGGGNLLPFALACPGAQLVGVDLSVVQVEQGQQVVEALGLTNLRLHAMSMTDITPAFGQFDYIIAHGVFSWIPPAVREAMMRVLHENLSPKGLGYISYNTYPGWKAGDIVRDAMLLHSHNAKTDEDRLASAKAVLQLLSDGIAVSNPLAPSLRAAVSQLRRHSDYYIAHEYLETFNNPCYLLEFANMADQHGLMHVGDVEPNVELSATYGQNVQLNHSLVAMGQPPVLRQQYLDFAVGRNFRKSLLVHQDRAGEVLASPDLDRLADLRWAAHFTESDVDRNTPKGVIAFRSHQSKPLYTRDPVVIEMVKALSSAWPHSLDFDALCAAVQAGADQEAADVRKATLGALQTLFRLNILRYVFEPVPYDLIAPEATPELIRGASYLQQRRQEPGFGIGLCNLWHESVNVQLKDAETYVLPYIDGHHTRKQLATLLRDALHQGSVPGTDGKSLKGRRNLDATADLIVGRLLDLLRQLGLLVC